MIAIERIAFVDENSSVVDQKPDDANLQKALFLALIAMWRFKEDKGAGFDTLAQAAAADFETRTGALLSDLLDEFTA